METENMSNIKGISEEQFSNLKKYLNETDEVSFAFLFGSRSTGLNSASSDYDIGIYFKPLDSKYIDIETESNFTVLDTLWTNLELLLKKEVDLVVLNNAPAHIASTIITRGIPISIKDQKLFLKFLLITTSNAIDYREFVNDYYKIYHRSASLSETDKTNLRKILIFLESEIKDYGIFKNLTWVDYEANRSKRREVERWVENLINSIIDISKILIASERMPVPDTYRELILKLKLFNVLEDNSIDRLAAWTKLRNILAHEYLDIRWTPIKNFISESEKIITSLIEKLKDKIEKEETGRGKH
jgi:uncharacterized protein YutE (UPF0331/DUF86 family)/predicted nucleotidyltransferase